MTNHKFRKNLHGGKLIGWGSRKLFGVLVVLGLCLSVQLRAAAAESTPRLNILLITVDALRPDHMSVYGYDRETTPYLSQFARESLVFESAFATSAWTSPGIVSMLTGYFPPVHGQNARHSYYNEEMTSALRILQSEGYDIVGHTTKGPNYQNLGMQRTLRGANGLERYIEKRILDNKPFFAWAHLKDVHLPYAPSERNAKRWGGKSRVSHAIDVVRNHRVVFRPDNVNVAFNHPGKVVFSKEDIPVIRALYDGVVADTDERLARILERMRYTGLLERTVVIISADHGEELFEHGWLGHASTSYDGKLYDELIRIPLLIRLPDQSRSGRFDALVQGVDVMPTIFEILGLDPARLTPAMQGSSLLDIVDGRREALRKYVYTQTVLKGWTTPREEMGTRVVSVRSKDHKLILFPKGDGFRYEGYNLIDDPKESHNIYSKKMPVFVDLENALDEWSERNRGVAAKLVLRAGRRQNIKLAESLGQGNLPEAVRRWQSIDALHDTWGMEVDPFFKHEPYNTSWTNIRHVSAQMIAKAMGCEAHGGKLKFDRPLQPENVASWMCRKQEDDTP